MLYVFFLLLKISLLTIFILIISQGLPQNSKSMDLKKEDEENVAYQEEAPAVPPKIPDSHLEKVTFIVIIFISMFQFSFHPKLYRPKCI